MTPEDSLLLLTATAYLVLSLKAALGERRSLSRVALLAMYLIVDESEQRPGYATRLAALSFEAKAAHWSTLLARAEQLDTLIQTEVGDGK